MTKFLLDTGPLTAFLYGRGPTVALIDPCLTESLAFTSELVYGEIVEHLLGYNEFIDLRSNLQSILAVVKPSQDLSNSGTVCSFAATVTASSRIRHHR